MLLTPMNVRGMRRDEKLAHARGCATTKVRLRVSLALDFTPDWECAGLGRQVAGAEIRGDEALASRSLFRRNFNT